MTELEARRRLLADPHRLSAELRAALAGDARLAALREELVAMDEAINRALTAPAVPEGLAERIVLNARYGGRSRWHLAMAATVAAFAVGFTSYLSVREPDVELARDRAILEHVAQNADELADDGHIEPAAFRASVGALGITVRDAGYRVRHLGKCVIGGIESRHFVLQSPRGAITYVILPGGGPAESSGKLLSRDGFDGLFMHRAGATIGVMAPKGTTRAELETLMRAVIA